jgi:alkylhydroperoxidase family enzyme
MPPDAEHARVSEQYADLTRRLREAVLGAGRGAATDPALRQAVEARSASFAGRSGPRADVPTALAPFVDKVAQRAYEVTDGDVRALREAGYSEQAIFEITASAALGAGFARLERGLAALRGKV